MLVEAALVLPLLVLIMIGGLDLGMAMLTAQRLQFATQAAAVCNATKNPNCLSVPDTQAYAALNSGIAASNFTVVTAGCGVQVSASFTFTPTLIPYNIPLAATACFPSS